jgi:trk system potassium uptake protein TrkA
VLPTPDTVLQENDTVHVLLKADDAALVERTLANPPAVTE